MMNHDLITGNRRVRIFLPPPMLVLLLMLSACASPQTASQQGGTKFERTGRLEKADRPDRKKALEYFVNGGLYEAKQQYSQAVLEYQDALKLAPDEPAIYYAIAKSYKELDKPESALYYARRATELDSTLNWYTELLGQLYYESRDYEKAIEQYQTLIRRNPKDVNSRYTLASLYTVSNQPDKAIEIYDQLTLDSGFDMDVLYQKLLLQMRLERYKDGLFTLQEMILVDPENMELYRTLGESYDKLKEYDKALAAYQEILARNPDDLKAQVAVSEDYIRLRNWKGFETMIDKIFARKELTYEAKTEIGEFYINQLRNDSVMAKPVEIVFAKLRKENPKSWRPYWILGLLKSEQRDAAAAEENFRKITELEPKFIPAWENLVIIYLQQNAPLKAADIAREGKKKQEKPSFRLEIWQGTSLSQGGRDTEAIPILEDAMKLDTDTKNDEGLKLQALNTLGIIYERMKRFTDSERNYEAAIKLDPKNALALNNLAYSLAERDQQLERCLEMAKIAVEKEPANASYLDTIGWIYYKLNKFEDARIWIQKSIDAGGASAVVVEHLGDIYLKLGDRQKAQEQWNKALEMDRQNLALRQKIDANK